MSENDHGVEDSPAIETHDLVRSFDDFLAVDSIGLRVPRGCFFGFLGPNGAGKSTTIKMLTGLLRITSGGASILGHDVERDARAVKRLIGVVPEDLPLFEGLTAAENLAFVARMHGLPRAQIAGRSGELLEMMDLTAGKKLVADFSHGMRKKLALACALIPGPRVLFLDEPFEGIDAVASRHIRALLEDLTERGVTVFLTSHILEIVDRLCTHVAVIHRGKLVAQGAVAEMGIDRTLEEIFLDLVDADPQDRPTLSWLA
ncbi:multidrug ABC transporter ATP-binding protein [bacterium CG_4_9_14_3_um_filter_65_15]|nr:MAG: multidrug ABC transporter ATP-binding protein [bacterium CG_4_9_14_3_um_filter_65_15]